MERIDFADLVAKNRRWTWVLLGASFLLLAVVSLTVSIYLGGGLLQLWRYGASLRCLLHAPGYIAWKCLLYGRVVTGGGSRAWVRGPRREAS